MIFVVIGIVCVIGLVNVFSTADKKKDNSRGWNHTPNITYKYK